MWTTETRRKTLISCAAPGQNCPQYLISTWCLKFDQTTCSFVIATNSISIAGRRATCTTTSKSIRKWFFLTIVDLQQHQTSTIQHKRNLNTHAQSENMFSDPKNSNVDKRDVYEISNKNNGKKNTSWDSSH